jgi:hypothetical protein
MEWAPADCLAGPGCGDYVKIKDEAPAVDTDFSD